MITLTFILILVATVTNSLFSIQNRLHIQKYHIFEVLCVIAYSGAGFFTYKTGHWIQFAIITLLIRFSLYSPIYNKVNKQPISYLGEYGVDKALKWLLYSKMKQGTDAIIWLYICSLSIAIMMYLNMILI